MRLPITQNHFETQFVGSLFFFPLPLEKEFRRYRFDGTESLFGSFL